jgi:hypothetical protein
MVSSICFCSDEIEDTTENKLEWRLFLLGWDRGHHWKRLKAETIVILIVFNGVVYLIRAETIVFLIVFNGVLYLTRAETIVILICFQWCPLSQLFLLGWDRGPHWKRLKWRLFLLGWDRRDHWKRLEWRLILLGWDRGHHWKRLEWIVFNGVLYLIRAETIVILLIFNGVLYLIRAETIVILIVFNGVQIEDTIEND